ncbi:hypothetical protein LXL04_002573 [Taraxacum kok-saghyz]
MSNTFIPNKSRKKQSDLRQFMFKIMKIQEISNPSPVDMNFGALKTSDVPLQEDELVYDVELLHTNRHMTYPLVFLLIKLMLILPVDTASVERVFSEMTFVKNKLPNSMGNQVLNDCLVTFIEKDVFLQVSDFDIINRYQDMGNRRVQL